jgi:hypothetical protein
MDKSVTARFRGYSQLQKEFADLNLPSINCHQPDEERPYQSQLVETSRQLHIHFQSDGSVPTAIEELFYRLNQEGAWLEITQQEDDSFTFSVITPIIGS